MSNVVQNLNSVTMRDGIDQRVEVESRQIRILGLDEDYVRCVVPREVEGNLLIYK